MNALVATNLRLKAEREAVQNEISLLKKKTHYFNYENNGKRFVCKGVGGKAVAEGKLMKFIRNNSTIMEQCYFQSYAKAMLAALKSTTE